MAESTENNDDGEIPLAWQFLIGVVLLGVTFLLLQWLGQEQARYQWPTVQGKVLASTIAKNSHPRRDSWDASRADSWDWGGEVTFIYRVEGVLYTHRQKWTTYGLDGLPDAERKFSPGNTVEVYYDPAELGQAVVEPGLTEDVEGKSDLGFVAFLLGLVGLAFLVHALVASYRLLIGRLGKTDLGFVAILLGIMGLAFLIYSLVASYRLLISRLG